MRFCHLCRLSQERVPFYKGDYMKKIFIFVFALFLLCACTKQTEETAGKSPISVQTQTEPFRKAWELEDTPHVIVPGAEKTEKIETRDKNHFGEYVSYGNDFYFRQYKKRDYNETALGGNYTYVSDRKRDMMCYTENGKLKALFSDNGVGSFYIYEDRFFAMTKTTPDGEIYSVDMKGENRHALAEGCILAADDKRGFLICQNEDLGLFSVNLNSVNWVITPLTLKGSFLAIEDGLVYYQESPEGDEARRGKVLLKRISTDGIGDTVLVQTKPNLYEDASTQGNAMIRRFYLTPYNIYFSYGSIAGTAAMYQGGGVMRVPKDGIGAQKLTDGLVGEDFFVKESGFADYLYFYEALDTVYSCKNLTTGEVTVTDIPSMPVDRMVVKDGMVHWLNADTGMVETIFSAADLQALALTDHLDVDETTEEEYLYALKNTVFSEQFVFTELYRHAPAPEEDIGWRTAYRLVSRAVLVKDRTTGEIKVLDVF